MIFVKEVLNFSISIVVVVQLNIVVIVATISRNLVPHIFNYVQTVFGKPSNYLDQRKIELNNFIALAGTVSDRLIPNFALDICGRL